LCSAKPRATAQVEIVLQKIRSWQSGFDRKSAAIAEAAKQGQEAPSGSLVVLAVPAQGKREWQSSPTATELLFH